MLPESPIPESGFRNGAVFRLGLAALASIGVLSSGIGRPSMWGDEIATVSGATRSIGSLLSMMQHVDSVHGVYYLFMHFWTKALGTGEFALRFPSTLAVAAAAVLLWLTMKPRFGERLAWFAFAILVTLPRLDWAATEARSYGFTALLGAALFWCLLQAIDAPSTQISKRYWVAYTFLLVVSLQVFLYLALMAAAQAVWLLLRHRNQLTRWFVSLGVSLAVNGYLVYWDILEKQQIDWIPPLGSQVWQLVGVDQYFEHADALAWVALALLCAAFFFVATGRSGYNHKQLNLLLQAALIVALPTGLVAGYSLFAAHSIYDPRYFTFSAPMISLLLAAALESLFGAPAWAKRGMGRLAAPVALFLVVALALQPFAELRTTTAKGTNWRTLANAVSELGGGADRTNTAVIYGDYNLKSPSVSRIRIGYPAQLLGFGEPTLVSPYQDTPGLYDHHRSIDRAWPRVVKYQRVLLVASKVLEADSQKLADRLIASGYSRGATRVLHGNWVTVFSKTSH